MPKHLPMSRPFKLQMNKSPKFLAPFLVLLSLLVSLAATSVSEEPIDSASPSTSPAAGRTIMLGFDGADARTVRELMAASPGEYPTFEKLSREGTFAPLEGVAPPESPVSWAAINTGQNPAKTGVPGFVKRALKVGEDEVDAMGTPLPMVGHQKTVERPIGELDAGPIDVASLGSAPTRSDRLITLAPSNAEVVHALACFDRVVACEDSSDHPPRTQEIPRLGPDLGPDLDRVAELEPDLVVSSLSVPGMERIVTGLRARALPQVVLAPRSLGDVCADVRTVAALLGVPEAGVRVVADIDAQRAALEADRSSDPVPVYLEWWPKPMFTPGIDCFSNELIALAGGRNVFGDRPGSSLQIESEELLSANPGVCFVSWCGVAEAKLDPQNLIGRPGLQSLSAAQQGHVYALDEQFSGRPGPRMLEAARRMATKIRGL